MPKPGLFASIADKTQQALNATPIGAKLHDLASGSSGSHGAKDQQHQPPPNAPPHAHGAVPHRPPSVEPYGHGPTPPSPGPPGPATAGESSYQRSDTFSGKHYSIETFQHQLRSLKAQYTSGVSPENHKLQLIITTQKGVALDYDAVARDANAQSKELDAWAQTQQTDLKDVASTLAFLDETLGALSYTLATEIDKSRNPWKTLRNKEAELVPRRNARQTLKNQLTKFQTDGGRTGGVDSRIAGLQDQLSKAESDDAPLERELELLKRSTIKESEALKWKAIKEYGQKLVHLAEASEQLLHILPPTPNPHYTGTQQTAAVKASLQKALEAPHVPHKPAEYLPVNTGSVSAGGPSINPAALNNTPAPIPPKATPEATPLPATTHHNAPSGPPPTSYHPPASTQTSLYAAPTAPPPSVPHPTTTSITSPSSAPQPTPASLPLAPTVAETGAPVSAGSEGPGPAHGTLTASNKEKEKDETVERPAFGYGVGSPNSDHFTHGSGVPPIYSDAAHPPSATEPHTHSAIPSNGGADEGAHLVASTSTRRPETHHESAEDEKKRLEREERERLLRGNTIPRKDDPDAPPAYE